MKNYLIHGFLFILLFSCKKKDDTENNTVIQPVAGTVSINGRVQKGPYKNGSPLTIFEINSSLGQTGKSFSTVLNDDVGNFVLNNIGLTTGYALLTVNGYYYMEHFNVVSPNQLYLEAISDVSSNSIINVNILTHIIKPRIEHLVSNGSSFATARTQAQNEFITFMGISSGNISNFEQLDVTNNAFLFAVSLLFQRNSPGYNASYNYTSELSSLLNKFRNDFADNGLIDSTAIIDTLIYNANRIQLIDVKENLQVYLSSIGVSITPPSFEQYIYNFQKLYSHQVFVNIIFPDSALYSAADNMPPSIIENILYETSVNFQGSNHPYLFAADIPCDSSLKIKFTSYSIHPLPYTLGQPQYGWKVSNSPGTFTLEAQQKNSQNAQMLYLGGTSAQDSAKIEYFENNDTIPYFTKMIHW